MNAHKPGCDQPLILVADDDELIRTLVVGALSSNGFRTLEVMDGSEVVPAVSQFSPDLVILDIDMPVMNGFTACEQIRDLPEYATLPVVMVTGKEDTDSIELAYKAGATDFISKPVNWSLLGHRIRYILRSASLRNSLAEREAENHAILKAIPDRVLRLSANGKVIEFERQTERKAGPSLNLPGSEKEPGHSRAFDVQSLFPSDSIETARQAIATVLAHGAERVFEYQQRSHESAIQGGDTRDAQRFFEARIVPHSDDVVLAIIRDVSARKASEARIEELAFFDELSGLPNRHHFMDLAKGLLGEASTAEDSFALATINLDRFKRINDTLGHEAGDKILADLAARLVEFKKSLSARGITAEIARLGADQFALIAGRSVDVLGPELPTDVLSVLQRSVRSRGMAVPISASMGIAHYPRDGEDAETLLKRADHALSTAKRRGRSQFCQYSSLREDASKDTLMLESELNKAIARGELRLQFQPKFRLSSGRIVGAEALLRWNHPRYGEIPPNIFIPLAEESALISEIDQWVVDAAAARLREWKRRGVNAPPLSINISGREFCYANPEASIAEAIDHHGVDPSLLEVEITETVMMEDPVAAARTLHRLKAMGIRLAMDDFGTGYSSLGYLKNYPLDVLKIDRAFVKDVQSSTRDQALCRSIIAIAKGLGMECVAEGIETEEQRAFLTAEGCDVAQGFALARPLEETDYLNMLASKGQSEQKIRLVAVGDISNQ